MYVYLSRRSRRRRRIYKKAETIMVRKRNMNKKRSQVAHYVKCELLVARRPLTIFSLSSCVRCRCLFHLFHFIRCRFEICVLCIVVYLKYPHQMKNVYLFYSVFRSFNCLLFFYSSSSARSFTSFDLCALYAVRCVGCLFLSFCR